MVGRDRQPLNGEVIWQEMGSDGETISVAVTLPVDVWERITRTTRAKPSKSSLPERIRSFITDELIQWRNMPDRSIYWEDDLDGDVPF